MKACYRRSMCKTLWQYSFFQLTILASITNLSLTFLWTVPIFLFYKVQSSSNTRSWKNFFFFQNWHWICIICMFTNTYIYMHMFSHTCNNILVIFQCFLKFGRKKVVFHAIETFSQRNLLKENITKHLALGIFFNELEWINKQTNKSIKWPVTLKHVCHSLYNNALVFLYLSGLGNYIITLNVGHFDCHLFQVFIEWYTYLIHKMNNFFSNLLWPRTLSFSIMMLYKICSPS